MVEALNAVKFLGWLKKFGPAQNILGPGKGQGIRSARGKLIALKKVPSIRNKRNNLNSLVFR